ncbi:MAG: hypothetical protein QF470_06135 [Methylococcales bacterium]|jgi:hypothetical protein|nr:hypothetical protein [Methylococcales bacterium]
MKKLKLATGLITALLVTSPIVGAEEYPAYNFKPIIVYQDKSAVAKPKVVKAASAAVKKEEGGLGVVELGLLVAIAGGVFFLRKGRSSGGSARAAGGSTGVDRYLAAQGGATETVAAGQTGVDRYLNS